MRAVVGAIGPAAACCPNCCVVLEMLSWQPCRILDTDLSQRTKELPAKEIKELNRDSVNKMEDSTKLVNASGSTLREIVSAVERVFATPHSNGEREHFTLGGKRR